MCCQGSHLVIKQASRGHPDLNRGPLDLQSNALPLSCTPLAHNGFSLPYFKWVTTPKHSTAIVNTIHSSLPLKLAKPLLEATLWPRVHLCSPEAPPLSKRYLSILVATGTAGSGEAGTMLEN